MMIRDCVTCVYFVESQVHSFSLSTLCGCRVVLLNINSLSCDVGCYESYKLHFIDLVTKSVLWRREVKVGREVR